VTATSASTRTEVRIAAVQMRYDDAESIGQRIERCTALIQDTGAVDLLVLPELWAHGGFGYDRWPHTAEHLDDTVFTAMARVARRRRVWLHAGSIIEREAGGVASPRLWNTSALFDPNGEPRAVYRKIHRFGFDGGEPRLLAAGEDLVTADLTDAHGATYRAGLTTCYDLRFPELYRGLVDEGSEVVLVPAAWPKSRVAHWEALGRARAIENQTVVVQCNLAGVDGDVVLGGSSRIVDANGDVLASAGADDDAVVRAVVDIADLRRTRQAFPVLADRRLR
jgi:predicted amidohydrolase